MVDANAQFLYATDHAIYAKRHYLAQFLREKTGSVIQHGILKGYELGALRWAEAAAGAYLLGTYEVHVCALLERLGSPDRVLIDIGAADGLYGVGLVAVGAFGRSVCFEADETCRHDLRQLAATLGLADKVAIHARAEPDTIRPILEEHEAQLDGAVVLCDIEGGEFDLLSPALLGTLARCHVIVETHAFLLPQDEQEDAPLASLKRRAARHFHVHEIKDGLRYVRDIPLLEDWSDADVWSICMEGRKRMMSWLYLEPKLEQPKTSREIDQIIYDYQRAMFE